MLTLDGSEGEGGGQILRTALTLSMITGTPFRMEGIRARRPKPGLLRQHLTCVQAATQISRAKVHGAELGSRTLTFSPQTIQGGIFEFAVGSAGSTTLVFQTIILPLLLANGRSQVTFTGGTHNPFAPTFDYLDRVFVPQLVRMSAQLRLRFERHGFYPAGGGRWHADIEPMQRLAPIELEAAGPPVRRHIRALVANIQFDIAEREAETARALLNWSQDEAVAHTVKADGPGNVIIIEIEHENYTEQFTGFGVRGTSAEAIATAVVGEVKDYLVTGAPIGPHLADQLLLPFAVAGAGAFVTGRPHQHTVTNISVIEKFLPIEFALEELSASMRRVVVTS